MSLSNGHRRLTIALGLYLLAVNGLTVFLMRRVPDDAPYIWQPLEYYTSLACLVSVLGIWGAKQSNPTLVAIFANFLILDVVVSALPRVLLVRFFPEIQESLCTGEPIAAWVKSRESSIVAGLDADAADAARRDAARVFMTQCNRVTTLLMVTGGLCIVALTMVQALLAARVTAYSDTLERIEDTEYKKSAQPIAINECK